MRQALCCKKMSRGDLSWPAVGCVNDAFLEECKNKSLTARQDGHLFVVAPAALGS